MTMDDERILVDWDGRGATAKRPTIGYEYKPGPHSTNGNVATPFRTARLKAIERKADRFADATAALRRRERAIDGHKDDLADPAWSVIADPVTIHLLKGLGFDDADVMRPRRTGSSMFSTGDYGFRLANGMEGGEIRGWRATNLQVTLHAGVLRIERIRLHHPSQEVRIDYSGGPRPHLSFTAPEGDMPASVLIAMRGRRLDEVVGAAPLAGANAAVTEAKAVDGRLQFGLVRKLAPYASAPADVEVNWLDDLARLS